VIPRQQSGKQKKKRKKKKKMKSKKKQKMQWEGKERETKPFYKGTRKQNQIPTRKHNLY
jgi:hypothetical protein